VHHVEQFQAASANFSGLGEKTAKLTFSVSAMAAFAPARGAGQTTLPLNYRRR